MSISNAYQGPPGPPGPMGATGPAGAPSLVTAGAGMVLSSAGRWESGGGSISIDYDEVIPEILRRLGLRAGDRLVVRSQDGSEREIPLTPLDLIAAREVVEE